jgi:hypothetical protein
MSTCFGLDGQTCRQQRNHGSIKVYVPTPFDFQGIVELEEFQNG